MVASRAQLLWKRRRERNVPFEMRSSPHRASDICERPPAVQAIVQERSRDWRARFGPLGIKLVELTGDSIDSAVEPLLRDADIM